MRIAGCRRRRPACRPHPRGIVRSTPRFDPNRRPLDMLKAWPFCPFASPVIRCCTPLPLPSTRSSTTIRTLVARHVRDDGCRARRRARRTAGRRRAAPLHLQLGRRRRSTLARRDHQPRAVDHARPSRATPTSTRSPRAASRSRASGSRCGGPTRVLRDGTDLDGAPVRDRGRRAGSRASCSTSSTTSTACSTSTGSRRRRLEDGAEDRPQARLGRAGQSWTPGVDDIEA